MKPSIKAINTEAAYPLQKRQPHFQIPAESATETEIPAESATETEIPAESATDIAPKRGFRQNRQPALRIAAPYITAKTATGTPLWFFVSFVSSVVNLVIPAESATAISPYLRASPCPP